MWLMMGLMIATMASGAITWAKQRLRQRTAPRPQPQAPGDHVRRRWPRRP